MTQNTRRAIRIGIGGWVYEPWRDNFYPASLPRKQELQYASQNLSSIEINSTFYGSQRPESFAKWHDETPDDFVFALKGPRFATHRRALAEAGESIERFFNSGVLLLKEKLGPINWQFAATKAFDPDDFERFLALLPAQVQGRPIRHAVEVRHDSFATPTFIALARQYGVATVISGDSVYPRINDLTGPFVYARIMGTRESEPEGYSEAELDQWAGIATDWAKGETVDLPTLEPSSSTPQVARDVYLYVISGYKARNPQAAMALIRRLSPQ